jgi:hypothetical protein
VHVRESLPRLRKKLETMTWHHALLRANSLSIATGRRHYIRGYQRTITHVGEWLYGVYTRPDIELSRNNRAHQWWIDG